MWNTVSPKQMGWKILHNMCSYCIQRHVSVRLCNRRIHIKHRCGGPIPDQTLTAGTLKDSTPGPPWRILFLGTDDFAVESLKLLSTFRKSSDGVVESLEVVTLDNDVPVKRFAKENSLPVHTWPLGDLQGRFDVGVVVSFGCLLRETLIKQFPYGILNVHPSLLPRWRGPAPVFHTILHGDTFTGVTVMQIRAKRFDVGPILHQGFHQIPENCTADQLGAALAAQGAGLLMETLKNLPERILHQREQDKEGATLAPKINSSMSWMVWEEQTCAQIDRLYRAIGSRIPLRTIWMGKTVKLLDFVGTCNISLSGRGRKPVPGCISYQKELDTLAVCCKDGWVGFKAVILKKRLSATDFYNGYLHQSFQKRSSHQTEECLFLSNKNRTELQPIRENTSTQHTVH
ncbi:methionyl-tRNA formyltransferase, mitochondrial isoform X2 [Hypomesus transpacificus]|uniref:methionyl-tRNA formyltransferase, mitochondrial isoform X2 n=1 Tax=Hypomesus transpacificus TaxID=137520 RepID=UPI001F0808BA|nr:methionyl-tRNA formyltransferase, mitochondrial isoform X2 [Hypomesus transpacificus]